MNVKKCAAPVFAWCGRCSCATVHHCMTSSASDSLQRCCQVHATPTQGYSAGCAGEQASNEVTAINPRAKVPAFRDGDVVVNESNAIMQYLEWAYPEPALMPKDPVLHARALQRLHELETLYNTVYPLFRMKMVATFDPTAQLDQVRSPSALPLPCMRGRGRVLSLKPMANLPLCQAHCA